MVIFRIFGSEKVFFPPSFFFLFPSTFFFLSFFFVLSFTLFFLTSPPLVFFSSLLLRLVPHPFCQITFSNEFFSRWNNGCDGNGLCPLLYLSYAHFFFFSCLGSDLSFSGVSSYTYMGGVGEGKRRGMERERKGKREGTERKRNFFYLSPPLSPSPPTARSYFSCLCNCVVE